MTNQKSLWRPWIIALAVVVFITVGIYAGLRAYRHWQPERLARQASGLVQKEDYKGAALLARRALQINPGSVSATRIMAEICEKINSPEAVTWRRQIVDLQPGSTKDILGWAALSLRFGQVTTAQKAIGMVKESDRNSAEYHSSAGGVEASAGHSKEAFEHYADAVKIEPANEVYQYNHAAAELASNNESERNAGIATLQKLTSSAKVGDFALRTLTGDSTIHRQLPDAVKYAKELQARSPLFSDRVMYVDLLKRANAPEFTGELERLQKDAITKPENAAQVVGWLGSNGMKEQAIAWSANFSKELLATPGVGYALVLCYAAGNDWTNVQATAKDGDWSVLEYLRLAYLARAARELNDQNGFRTQWNAATTEAAKQREALTRLAQLVTRWGWKDELRDLLWSATTGASNQNWALQLLYQHYVAQNDTRGVYKVLSRMVEVNPENEAAKNNFAMCSLLLKTNVERAATIAHELYVKSPTVPAYVSTYAYALHLQGKTDEALQTMNKLPAAQLEDPSVAVYYGILLMAKSETDKAQKYLDLGEKAQLLPEEKELVLRPGKVLISDPVATKLNEY